MTLAPAVVRASDVEELTAGGSTLHLLADCSATGGALTSHRVRLRDGGVGANPHHHRRSSELFYVLDGEVDLLAGEQAFSAVTGDLVVIPPGLPHAFGASAGQDAELLVVATPGVERFEFFRSVAAVMAGRLAPEALAADQARYDNHAAQSPAWVRYRAQPPAREMEQR